MQSKLDGLYEMKEELIVRSPIDGVIVDMESNLHPGRWVNTKLRLAHIAQLDNYTLQGVIEGNKLSQGEAKSFAFRTYDLIAVVLIRESGF